MLKLNGHQRYLPPPPLTHYSQQNLSVLGTSRDDLHSNYTTNYTKYTSERHLDDMHDWAIYRTNVNSKYAGGAMQRMQPLPFGEFYLDPSTVDSLHASAKYQQASAFAAESDPHMYIEFGLPRLATKSATSSKVYSSVNLPIEKTAHPWQKPQRKLAHSSGDVSEERASGDAKRPYQRSRSYDAILEEPSREDTAHLISARERKERREEMRQFSRSQPQGVENYAYSADDVHDQRNIDQWESTWERISASVAKKRPLSHYQDDVASAVNANLKVAADSYYKPTSSNLAYDTHPANYRRPAEERYTFEEHKSRGFLENSWQGLGSIDALRAVPYPHLQLRNLTHEVKSKQQGGRIPKQRTSRRILDNLSFEVHGGEIMAIMGHSGSGKTCLLEILGNRMRNGKTVGSVVLNGNLGTTSDLYKKVAHVRKETHLVPYLTVAQTLKFFLMFKKPEHMGWKSKSAMVEQLIDEIRLAHVRDTKVGSLASGEKKRLNLVCQVALDTDIILLDEPTTPLETYPAIFLMEYLRTLAARDKMIIMSIQHPSMDIFSMIDKVVLLSSGKMMYYGAARGMVSYFSAMGFSYPPLVNPCDYYVDLVTLDDRTYETLAESNDRINKICANYIDKAPVLSDPEPSIVGLRRIRHTGGCLQFFILLGRLFTCHGCTLRDTWLQVLEVFLAALMSVLIGAIFSSEYDRLYAYEKFSFFFVMLVIAPLPYVYRTIGRASEERRDFYSEVDENLYSPVALFFAKILGDIPIALIAALAYMAPAYWIAEMSSFRSTWGMYLALMFIYIYGLRLMAIALSNVSRRDINAASAAYLIVAFLGASCGWIVHPRILKNAHVFFWSMYVSNSHWAYREMVQHEMAALYNYSYPCGPATTTTTTVRPQLIITEPEQEGVKLCWANTEDFLSHYGMQERMDAWIPFVVVAAFGLFFFVFAFIAIAMFRVKPRRAPRAQSDPVTRAMSEHQSVFTM